MADTSRYDATDVVNKEILVTILEAGGEIGDPNGWARDVLMRKMVQRGFTVPQNLANYLARLERDGWVTLDKGSFHRLLVNVKLTNRRAVEKITQHLRDREQVIPLEIGETIQAELPEPAVEPLVVPERAAGTAADIADALLQKLVEKLQAPTPKPNEALQTRIQELENLLRLRQSTIDTMKRRVEELGTENQILRKNALNYQERGGQLETQIAKLLAPEQQEALAYLAKQRPQEKGNN